MIINDRLRGRPTFQGLPVPFVQFIRADGTPDFRVVDDGKRWRCVRESRCGLCGERLDGLKAFIGGPLAVANRTWLDPAMHNACAQDAMRLCPYLARGKNHFRGDIPTRKVSHGTVLTVDEHASDQRPEKMAIYVTRSYRTVTIDGQRYIRGAIPVRVEWFDSDGKRLEIQTF